ncbi:hypothetical protein BDW22DRAFT_1349417 [Trametopsis cervina]|nr:hypothetical protein BDW22DRAFT_1349417 [Trametopsis cervina]
MAALRRLRIDVGVLDVLWCCDMIEGGRSDPKRTRHNARASIARDDLPSTSTFCLVIITIPLNRRPITSLSRHLGPTSDTRAACCVHSSRFYLVPWAASITFTSCYIPRSSPYAPASFPFSAASSTTRIRALRCPQVSLPILWLRPRQGLTRNYPLNTSQTPTACTMSMPIKLRLLVGRERMHLLGFLAWVYGDYWCASYVAKRSRFPAGCSPSTFDSSLDLSIGAANATLLKFTYIPRSPQKATYAKLCALPRITTPLLPSSYHANTTRMSAICPTSLTLLLAAAAEKTLAEDTRRPRYGLFDAIPRPYLSVWLMSGRAKQSFIHGSNTGLVLAVALRDVTRCRPAAATMFTWKDCCTEFIRRGLSKGIDGGGSSAAMMLWTRPWRHPRRESGTTMGRLALLKSAAHSRYLAHNGDDAMLHIASKRGKTNDVDATGLMAKTPDRSVSGSCANALSAQRRGGVAGLRTVKAIPGLRLYVLKAGQRSPLGCEQRTSSNKTSVGAQRGLEACDDVSHHVASHWTDTNPATNRAVTASFQCPEPGLFLHYNGRDAPSIPHSQRLTFSKQRLCLQDSCNCPPLCLRPCTLPHHASSDRSLIPRIVCLIRSSAWYYIQKQYYRTAVSGLSPVASVATTSRATAHKGAQEPQER